MVSAPPAPTGDMYAFATTPEPTATEEVVMKLAAQPQTETPAPAAAPEATPAVPSPEGDGRGAFQPEATPELAARDLSATERGEVGAPFWAEVWVWRAAEGALAAMFVALLVITVTGWRRVARM